MANDTLRPIRPNVDPGAPAPKVTRGWGRQFDPETLHPDWRDWIDKIALGKTVKEVADLYGVEYSHVIIVKNCPAGRLYMQQKLLEGRFTLNALVVAELVSRMIASGTTLPIDILVKIYGMTVPKESAVSSMELLRMQAHLIARENNLSEEAEDRLMQFLEAQAV